MCSWTAAMCAPIRADELHRRFGVVFQNDVIFADTIRENMAFGRDVTRRRCIRRPGRHGREFVEAYDDGMITRR